MACQSVAVSLLRLPSLGCDDAAKVEVMGANIKAILLVLVRDRAASLDTVRGSSSAYIVCRWASAVASVGLPASTG